MEEQINPTEGQVESGEAKGAEQESLNDATFEPRSHVEQTGDYERAETVQQNFETIVNNTIAQVDSSDIPATIKEGISAEKSKGTIKDPLTGKGGDNQGSSTGSESSNEPVMDKVSDDKKPTDLVSDSKGVGHEDPGKFDPGNIDGNEPVFEMETKETDKSGAITKEGGQPEGKTGNVDPQRFGDGKLPEELLYPQEKPGMKGPKSGGKKPGTPPKSGGGPPVGGHGSGSKGSKGGYHDHDSTEGRYLFMQMVFSGKHGYVMEKDGKGVWAFEEDGFHYYEDFDIVNQTGQTFDGDTGMPYTGSSSGGEDPDPERPIGGPDGDSGKIHPIFGKGGGGDKGGGTPGDKDGDDDSGKFLADGTMGGGGGGMVDPGDLDYYTPTDLETKKQNR